MRRPGRRARLSAAVALAGALCARRRDARRRGPPPEAASTRSRRCRTASPSSSKKITPSRSSTCNLTYHVGSKNEKPGRTGFAHLFEHLMFKGSKNVEPEGHTSMIASIGGQSNAFTTEDETAFWETAPSQYLPLMLWLEADRMATLRIDNETFVSEREVVKEERRLRIDNQPYGRLNEIIYDQMFTTHPYKHLPIGSMVDLDAATVDDVRDFYRHVLRARERDADARRRHRLDAGACSSSRSISAACRRPRSRCRATSRKSRRRPPSGASRCTEPWPLPAVVVAYHITYDGNPDSYPLHIAGKVLSDGAELAHLQEARLRAAARGGRVRRAESDRRSESVLRRRDRAAGTHAGRGRSTALIAEFDRLKNEPITERELQRTKNQFARDYILSRESDQDKARVLSHAVVIHHDIKTADGEFDIFQSLTAADVQRVARTYFTASNRTVLTLMPSGRAGGAEQMKVSLKKILRSVCSVPLWLCTSCSRPRCEHLAE